MHILTLRKKILLEDVLPLHWWLKGSKVLYGSTWYLTYNDCQPVPRWWEAEEWSTAHRILDGQCRRGFCQGLGTAAWWGDVFWSLLSLLTLKIDTYKAKLFSTFWPALLLLPPVGVGWVLLTFPLSKFRQLPCFSLEPSPRICCEENDEKMFLRLISC